MCRNPQILLVRLPFIRGMLLRVIRRCCVTSWSFAPPDLSFP
jgi:hypothetical protein